MRQPSQFCETAPLFDRGGEGGILLNSMKHRAVLIAEVRRDAAAACRHTGHAGGRIAIRKGAVAPAEFRNDVRDCAAVCRTGAAAEVIVSDNRLAIMDCADGVWNLSKKPSEDLHRIQLLLSERRRADAAAGLALEAR